VIVVVPADNAVRLPGLAIAPTAGALLDQVSVSGASGALDPSAKVPVATMVSDTPMGSFPPESESFIDFRGALVTVMFASPERPSFVAVITAVPGVVLLTRPVALTETAGLLEVQETPVSAFVFPLL
jgi:hypothetical protein